MEGNISIKKVSSRRDMRDFLLFPKKVYSNYPNWIAPLEFMIRNDLNMKKNPFWKHADGKLFIAVRNGDIVGRISAQIDHLFNSINDTRIGYFGYFECLNDNQIAQNLFNAAEDWLKKNNIQVMRGPFSPSINGECGFMTHGFDKKPVFGSPYNPQYYISLAHSCGFKTIKELRAYEKTRFSPTPELISRVAERVKRNSNIILRPFNIKNRDNDIRVIMDLYNECWADNWGFTPMNFHELNHIIGALNFFKNETLILLAYDKDTPIGMCVAIPDINELIDGLNGKAGIKTILRFLFSKKKIKGCKYILICFKKKYRTIGSAALLLNESMNSLRKRYDRAELSWILEDNKEMNTISKKIGADLYKKYAIVERDLLC